MDFTPEDLEAVQARLEGIDRNDYLVAVFVNLQKQPAGNTATSIPASCAAIVAKELV